MSPNLQVQARVRAAFISDLHLGTRECQADEIAAFLRRVEMETLYLVGDIVDLWSMRRGIYWPAAHQDVLRQIIDKVRSGTRVVYVPGNHDELARPLAGSLLAGIEVHHECIHVTRDGRRMLVMHGDAFDAAVRFSPALRLIGGALYGLILIANRPVNWVRTMARLPRWSLVRWLKSRVGNAMTYVNRFEQAAAAAAAARGVDGIVCGHIHRPHVAQMNGVLYCNDGDWVEHCTALVEDRNGKLSIWDQRGMAAQAVAINESLREAA
jgi:UDP-2,3-diacylglucosamine pyrophosphatase LpxH